MRLSTANENLAIAAAIVPTTTYYLALFTSDPGTTGASGEVTGGSYARQAITFGAAANGQEASTDAQTFTNMPALAGGVPYFAIFSAATSGTFECGGTTVGLGGALAAGTPLSFAIGTVIVSLS